jgi:hypothetical protein
MLTHAIGELLAHHVTNGRLFSGYSRTLGLKKPLPWRQAMSILLQLAGSHGAYAVSRSISVCT